MILVGELINGLLQHNIPLENIHVDPLVQPVATDIGFGLAFLNAIERIMTVYDGVHTLCGLSNVSYGLPNRPFLNRIFISMAIAKGLDGAIINPLDPGMMGAIVSATALAGRDDYCMAYLKAFREGKIEK